MARTTTRLNDIRGDRAFIDSWNRLVDQLDERSYFQRPAWMLAWHDHYAAGKSIELTFWTQNGEMVALLPLVSEFARFDARAPVGVKVLVHAGTGQGNADHCNLLAVPEARGVLRAELLRRSRTSTLLLHSVDSAEDEALLRSLDAVRIGTRVCPFTPLSESAWAVPVQKKATYYLRRLSKLGFELEWLEGIAVDQDVLDELYRLHENRWTARVGMQSRHLRSRNSFFNALIRSSDRRAALCVVRLTDGGSTAASLLGFTDRDTFYYFQTGWHEDYATLSPGTAIVAGAMRMAYQRGHTTFDFLRGDSEYKARFGAIDRPESSWMLPSGLGGYALRRKYARALGGR